MSNLSTQANLTPLDTLRLVLSEYVPGDNEFPRRLSQKLGEIGRNSLTVMAEFLKRPGTSALRKAVLPLVAKHDWPEWAGLLFEILSTEPELAVFDEGCAVLGALGTKSSWKTLQRLKSVRTDRDRQIILDRELNELDTRQPLSHYMSRLSEGEGNPRLVAVGAKMIAVLAHPSDIPAIIQAFHDGDKLVKQQLLRILPCIQCPETVTFLAYGLKNSGTDIIESRKLLDLVNKISQMARPSAKEECQALVYELFRVQAPTLVDDLKAALAQQDADASHIFDAMEEVANTQASSFALESLRLLVEGKVARFSVITTERAEEIEKQLEDLELVLDHFAAALARLTKEGGAECSEVLPYYREVFKLRLGEKLFLESYASLVSHTDTEILDEFLADPDFSRRFILLDAIGAKEDEHFVDFFLKATGDSIVDVGQCALWHLGKLRKGQLTLIEYFQSGDPEKMRLALWGIQEIQLQEAADILIEFIHKDLEGESVGVKSDLLVGAANALASLRVAKAAMLLMEMLHDGQPLKLQTALAEALVALKLPDIALGLLEKSKVLKHSEVLFTVLEGVLPPFNGFGNPFPKENYETLQNLLDRCCDEREGEGQRFRAYCAMEGLYILDVGAYEKLQERISDYLSVTRSKGGWDKEANDRLTAILKDLAKRCDSLKVLAQKETDLTNHMDRTAPKGPHRSETLQALRASLDDPELIITAEMEKKLADYVLTQIKVAGQEWKDVTKLCEIAGFCSNQKDLIEPIKMIHARATGLGLKSAARNALIKLGLTEAEINRRGTISKILVIEPSAFFRKRLVEAIKNAGSWEMRETGSKEEAETMLEESETDLLICECIESDGGKMLNWFQTLWEKNKFKYAYLCTASRDLSGLGEPPWLIGVLHKPFPMEKLIDEIKS
jgi:hypothetical protein